MALAPKFAGHLYLLSPVTIDKPLILRHTLEIYLDYVCPFSAKIFNTLYNHVLPSLKSNQRIASRLQVIFRHQVQPWHPSSTLAHEAAIAVLREDGSKFWNFSQSLFAESKSFYDVSVNSETRNQTYARLAAIAGKIGVSECTIFKMLKIDGAPGENGELNVGNSVTDDLKVLVKMGRLVGIHVSPTVLWDGVVEPNISSSWTAEQWTEWLDSRI